MNLFYKFRLMFYRFQNNIAASSPRNASLLGLDEIQTIGLIFDIRNEQTVTEIVSAVDDLQAMGKTVTMLGYVHNASKQISYPVPFFSLRNTTFSLAPDDVRAHDFLNGKYDLLVAFATDLYPPVEHLVRHAHAVCKAGVFTQKNAPLFDFMIELRGQQSAGYYFKQLTHYLQQIRK